jgi:two-component system CheB/CheR fusion protein
MHTKGEVILDEEGKPVWFSGTMQNITQRNHAELKLKELNADLEKRAAELKASNAELERFAYVASHDLQEPLRMVTSFLALLQKKHSKEFDETSKKYIHFAVDGAERMKGLIQDLLQYSKLDASNIKFTSFNLQEAVEQVLHILALSIKENEAVIHVGPLPVINGNKLQVTQLFQNLLGNALKYRSEKTPEIEIECKEENDQWLFSIRDNGIGIDPKYFDKIFVIFQRLHNKNEYSGTGIGLAICKKIIESHGGRIWVDSHPHQGSTFHFTLKKNNHA